MLILGILTAAVGLQVQFSGPVFAYGTCGPSTQTTKLQYTNMGCIYTSPKWFSQASQQNAHSDTLNPLKGMSFLATRAGEPVSEETLGLPGG